MANKRTIVEINGRKYDANTGKMLSELPTATRVIDGFTAATATPKSNTPQQPKSARTVNSSSNLHAKPQKTKKLHPTLAKAQKPTNAQITSKSKPAAQKVSNHASQRHNTLKTAPARQVRAASHSKSDLISKFGGTPVQAEVPAPVPVAAPKPDPVIARPMAKPIAPESLQAVSESVAQQQMEAPKKEGRLKRLMQAKPKAVPITMAVVSAIAIGGFVTYQNIPNMALRVAAQRAGFNASLPGYNPSGFSFSGPVSYSEGVVELEYSSASDDRTFSITQRDSSWDSQSLLDNFVSINSDDHLTFQERGLTVYMYGPSSATWVDGGIWYTIEGESMLTSEQILKIAGSL